MKYIFVFTIFAFFITACASRSTTNTVNVNATTAPADNSKTGKLANSICDCLKPLSDLQNNFETQKISPQEYGNQLQKLSISMQKCTNKLTEATDGRPDFKDEVLFKMKQTCPGISEIIVPAQ